MIKLKLLMLAALLVLVVAMPAGAQQRIFILPGDNVNSALVDMLQSPLTHLSYGQTAPGGAFAVADPTGSRYFVVSNFAGASTLTVVRPDGTAAQTLSLGLAATKVMLTPDGRRLLVLSSGGVYVLDVTGSTVGLISTPGVGYYPVDMDVSLDSRRAFVLSPSDQRVYVIDLTAAVPQLLGGSGLAVLTSASGLAVGPNGLVYVSAIGQLLEVDGGSAGNTSMNLLRTIQLAAGSLPTRAAFSPNGQRIVLGTKNASGFSIAIYDFSTNSVRSIDPFGAALDQVVVVDNSRAFALSTSSGNLYGVNLDFGTIGTATFVGGVSFSNVTSIACSNEVPQAASLYVASANKVQRVDLSSNQAAESVAGAKVVTVATVPATGTVSSVQQFSATQSVTPGGVTIPMVVRAVNSNGQPLVNVAVAWSSTGPTTVSAMSATNEQGLAAGTFQAPMTVGQYSVTANVAGAQSVNFTVSVSTSATPGGGGGTPTSTGGVVIVSGQGQVVPRLIASQEPLIVQVNDTSGNAVPFASVTWTISGTTGTATIGAYQGGFCTAVTSAQIQCTADASGRSSIVYQGTSVTSTTGYAQFTITAAAVTGSATFYATVLDWTSGPTLPAVSLVSPDQGATITAQAGTTLPAAIKAQISASLTSFVPLPNIGIEASTGNTDPNLGPTANCSSTSLSDANGVVACDLVVGPKTGTTRVTITVGGIANLGGFNLVIESGPPAKVNILGGNNQHGTPGQTLPLHLLAEIRDVGGNLLPGASATWAVLTTGGATVSPTQSTADSSGRVSTQVTLGSTPGPVQIQVTSGSGSATFTVNVDVSLSGPPTKVAGDNQTAVVNTAFATPLTVQVNSSQGALANFPVTFAVTSGSATLSAASATTNAQGQASVTATAGATAGAIQVTATAGGQSVVFSLAARLPGPVLTAQSFLNGASFQAGFGFGSVVTIQADGLSTGLTLSPGQCLSGIVSGGSLANGLPTRVGGVEVLFGSILAPIFAVCKTADGKDQVNVQAPFELAPGPVLVVVRTGAGTPSLSETAVNGVQVLAAMPGIFEYAQADGTHTAVAQRPDGSVVSSSNPAHRGETIRVFVTGLGPVLPTIATNQAGVPGQVPFFQPVVQLGGAGMAGVTGEYAENLIGVFVVTFQVPADAQTGNAVSLTVNAAGDTQTYNGSTSHIAVQ